MPQFATRLSTIEIARTATGAKHTAAGYLSACGLFAVGYTVPDCREFGWTVTHTPTGRALVKYVPTRRTAELIAAALTGFPIDWNRTTAESIIRQYESAPIQLRQWVSDWQKHEHDTRRTTAQKKQPARVTA